MTLAPPAMALQSAMVLQRLVGLSLPVVPQQLALVHEKLLVVGQNLRAVPMAGHDELVAVLVLPREQNSAHTLRKLLEKPSKQVPERSDFAG